MPKKLDLAGKNIGNFFVIKEHGKRYSKRTWICKCICGNKLTLTTESLTRGRNSCGCIKSERLKNILIERNLKHGMSKTRVYRIWFDMRRRCEDSKNKRYDRYGGRGIKVCKEWSDFEIFLRDMGEPPEGKSLDRIDNNKGYSKKNCRWSTIKEQANNRSNNTYHEINGEKLTTKQVSEIYSINYQTLRSRLNRDGQSIEEILNDFSKS